MQLFDAAIVADRGHAASWHGWGLLEKRAGKLSKAKDLWMKVRGQDAEHGFTQTPCCSGIWYGFSGAARAQKLHSNGCEQQAQFTRDAFPEKPWSH